MTDEQPKVTRGTAISASAGTGATVAVGAETVQWLWDRVLTGEWAAMPVSTAALLGALMTGLLSLIVWVIYWRLGQYGIKPPRKPTSNDVWVHYHTDQRYIIQGDVAAIALDTVANGRPHGLPALLVWVRGHVHQRQGNQPVAEFAVRCSHAMRHKGLFRRFIGPGALLG